MDFLKQLIPVLLLAIPVGFLASILFQWMKKLSGWVDALGPWSKRLAVFVISSILTAVSTALGVTYVCDPGANFLTNCLAPLDEGTVKVFLEALLAVIAGHLTHAKLMRAKPPE